MQVIELPEAKFEPLTLGFSADGHLLAAWGWGRAYIIDTAAATVRGVYGAVSAAVSELPGVGFSADGRAVIVHSYCNDPPVRVHALDTGKVLRKCPVVHRGAMDIGPGGRFVYYAHYPRQGWVEIVRWDPLTGKVLPSFARHRGFLCLLAVSADEKWVAGATYRDIRVWNLGGAKLPARSTRHLQIDTLHGFSGLTLSSDGAFVAYSGPGAGIGLGDARTGRLWKVSDSGAERSREVAFHPTRPVLAFSGNSKAVTLYDAAARAELKRYTWKVGTVTATCFSPDGLRCAAAARGRVVIWDVDV